jgi:hypothetical protein
METRGAAALLVSFFCANRSRRRIIRRMASRDRRDELCPKSVAISNSDLDGEAGEAYPRVFAQVYAQLRAMAQQQMNREPL